MTHKDHLSGTGLVGAVLGSEPDGVALLEERKPEPVAAPLAKKPDKPYLTLSNSMMMGNQEWFICMAEAWDTLPEEIKDAMILMQRPVMVKGGGREFLNGAQSLMVVRFCNAKGLDKYADHWFFDSKNYRIGQTTSGLRAEARHRGMDLGPPQLERIERPWPSGRRRPQGFETGPDWGYRCSMEVPGKSKPAVYEAYFSTSAQTYTKEEKNAQGVIVTVLLLKIGPWTDNYDHMMQVAAQRHCLRFAMGSGISEPLDD